MFLRLSVIVYACRVRASVLPAPAGYFIHFCYHGVVIYALSSIICVAALPGACEEAHTCTPQGRGQGVCKSDISLEVC